ncbi:leucine-zipper of insertion element IS481 [Streptomyces sp. DvalAA-14]|nr:hypothetical protein [Streptomyces sp. SID4948]SCE14417.1 leucine-zipper of insertion element IS481 [Streptomyces sp. DvalAA-14]
MKFHGERNGIREPIEVLSLGRDMPHERVVADLAAALQANARLTDHGRAILVERVRSGRPVGRAAAEMGISSATAHT